MPSIFLELRFHIFAGTISSDHILARSPVPRTELPHDRTVVLINLTVESQLESWFFCYLEFKGRSKLITVSALKSEKSSTISCIPLAHETITATSSFQLPYHKNRMLVVSSLDK
ncbi:hypothetical protein D5086_010745 [Populus alba]|uniref:Uncharacterized protein n=1 Tax=Populus alba TaxID=43335 RepID=A0ACC4CBG7_POPAL